MEATSATIAIIIVIVIVALMGTWKVLNRLWLRPKRIERVLREQGFQGNPYTLLVGDVREVLKAEEEAKSKPMNFSNDILPRLLPSIHQTTKKHGKNSFIWYGPIPRVTIADPELIKDVFNKTNDFPTRTLSSLVKLVLTGLINYNGEKWHKHRRIINPAFNLQKLKIILPKLFKSCNDMISKWEGMLSSDGSCEMDVWPFLQNLASDIISRTAFGSNYEEGRRIFQLQKEQAKLTTEIGMKIFVPGWRFLPTSTLRRIKEIDRDIQASLKVMIKKRENAMKVGEAPKNDLLGLLLASNQTEIQEGGNIKNVGMTLQDVIDECKLFYFAGQETTSVLLVWTMVLLSRYPDWQARAREEVLQVFGNQEPDFDGLSQLKIVTMILYEVLRLYPPASTLSRWVHKDTKLGNLILPAGIQVSIPVALVHHDCELWGDDAMEFKPERFSDGVLKATNGRLSFLPFGWGPRICIGQNFAILEVKMALSIILPHFLFELSPAYTHAPTTVLTLQPQYGARVIIHKL